MPQYQHTVISPGRVNLLGEHVDYSNGPVLPVAIDRKVRLSFSPREDRLVIIRALDLGEEVCFSLDNLATRLDCKK
ncbi:MAG: hypothetical protein K8R40_12965, partial [Anaerolineaceae bacterium]|nr:hypothetical protein [Anaerolineaceae bacterium]